MDEYSVERDLGLPKVAELEFARKKGVPALRREIVHNTTTQSVYKPGETCIIPFETGLTGAFTDTSTVRLLMNIDVSNTNAFIDFINLSPCGWHAIIKELSVEINGINHELNTHYAECVKHEMESKGENLTSYEITISNAWELACGTAGKHHVNFVKPSMCLLNGAPHNVIYQALTTLTSDSTPDIITLSMLFNGNSNVHESLGRVSDTMFASNEYMQAQWFATSSIDLPQSYYDDRLPRTAHTLGSAATTYDGVQQTCGLSFGDQKNIRTHARLIGLPHGSNELASYSKNHVRNISDIYTAAFGQSVSSYPCSMWPVYQPCDLSAIKKGQDVVLRLVNSENIINYYANCKNIPVGIPVYVNDDKGEYSIWGANSHTRSSLEQTTRFNVSLKLYSSLIGELSKKWFPEMVIPSGHMRVKIKFQETQILFQTLMDPCRRVPGTSRDWLPYTGMAKLTENTSFSDFVNQDCANIASGIHPIMISNYEAGDVFTDSIAMGRYVVPQMRMKGMHTLPLLLGMYPNQYLKSSDEFTYQKDYLNLAPFIDNGTFVTSDGPTGSIQHHYKNSNPYMDSKVGLISSAMTATILQREQEYGYPPVHYPHYTTYPNADMVVYQGNTTPRKISDFQYYTYKTDHDYKKNKWVESWDTAATKNQADDSYYKAANWNPFCFPTPQYVPILNPSDKTNSRSDLTYVNENQLCFGTYLKSSQAQVRRTHATLYPLDIPDAISSKINSRLTYSVSNVQLISQQIILPRSAALSIIDSALQRGISMETTVWKEVEQILPQQATHKTLINLQAALCSRISFVFRPLETLQGDQAYGYNSFSFYNPFTSFNFINTTGNQESTYNWLGGKPVYYNECVCQERTPINVQLQLAGELYPRNPIDNINKLIQYTKWGDYSFGKEDYMQLNPSIIPSYNTEKGMIINTLQDGFWACFTPIHCLDDQTITCNPFFVPLELSLRKRLRGSRHAQPPLPIFKPFDGSFHLSFNFETFLNTSDAIKSGVPIVNNNMYLRFEKAHMVRDFPTQLLAIAVCNARVVFERGGSVSIYS